MGRVVISAMEVEQARTTGHLVVPAGAIITPLARDVAAEYGVELVASGSAPQQAARPAEDELGQRVRAMVTALLANGGAGISNPRPAPGPTPPVKLVRAQDAVLEPFPYPGPPPTMSVRATDVVTSADRAPMAAGYLTLTAGTFPWTLSYDEIQIVLEGELHIGTADGVRIGRPGDILFVPRGSAITFGTPEWAKFVYVTFPADWEAQL